MAFYFLFLFLVFRSLVIQLFLSKVDDPDWGLSVPLGMVWLGMTLQSLVNPVSLTLAVWHFLSGAFLLGLQRERNKEANSRQSRAPSSSQSKQKTGLKSSRQTNFKHKATIHRLIVALSVIPLLFAANSAVGVYQGDADVYRAIARGDGQALLVAVLDKNSDPELMKTAVRIFNDNSMKQFSIRILNELTRRNPDDFYAWQLLYITSTSQADRARALNRMKELDPLTPELSKLVP
ncbi:MAG: hypothetical protein FJY67_12205 [Calditrichaeota bacterium]|nr:hypothetical protein [Calditrichota bacterium]